jgi:hypothetical protein
LKMSYKICRSLKINKRWGAVIAEIIAATDLLDCNRVD